jgi:catechol 2,3-dioxygenase-like lactoylglutathione lyase family enzyme
MPIGQLNHVTLRTDDLEGYAGFLPRRAWTQSRSAPAIGFRGYWLYVGENPVVHLVPKSHGIGGGPSQDTGNFDHVPFTAANFSGMRERLKQRGIKFREQQVPASPARQIFLEDPNSVMIELNFPSGG